MRKSKFTESQIVALLWNGQRHMLLKYQPHARLGAQVQPQCPAEALSPLVIPTKPLDVA